MICDGGLSTALDEAGHRGALGDPLWTARFLVDDPEPLVAAHLAFVRAGARVLTTASYQASRAGFVARGLSPGEADAAVARSTAVAREAIGRFGDDGAHVRVAASVGPYGAVLADGSEYTGRYGVTHDALVAFHAERLQVLVASAPDLLACETLPGAFEATAIAEALAQLGGASPPAWVSFTCRSATETADGGSVDDAFAAALAVPGVVAIGVNCTAPALVTALLERAARLTDLPLVAYPNRGQTWRNGRWRGAPDDAFSSVDTWVALGARYVGGCCGVGPADISALAARLAS